MNRLPDRFPSGTAAAILTLCILLAACGRLDRSSVASTSASSQPASGAPATMAAAPSSPAGSPTAPSALSSASVTRIMTVRQTSIQIAATTAPLHDSVSRPEDSSKQPQPNIMDVEQARACDSDTSARSCLPRRMRNSAQRLSDQRYSHGDWPEILHTARPTGLQ